MKISSWVSVVLCLFLVELAQGDTRSQNFSVDPGWSTLGSGTNGNNFGFQPASSFAGGSPGEAGGTFTRSLFTRMYADTNIGSLNLNQAFLAAGKFDYTAQNRPDFGTPLIIGHFSTSGISTANVNNMVGIGIDNGGTVNQIYWTGVVVLADGTNISVLPKTLLPTPNGDHTWLYAFNPNGGASGVGFFSFQLDGSISNVDLTVAQRAIGFSANAFGFGGGPAGSNQDSSFSANLYTDDLSYSVVPEPASLVLAAVGAAVIGAALRRKWRLNQPISIRSSPRA